jgi:Dinucleotide-utilizing enzymes involved in molybdopterin and thiamine biosynthesis family 2
MIRPGFYDEDRFDRSRRIEWLDIEKIHEAKCLVVGAGALGNEVVKNLVLSGFRNITVVDMDDIVLSNLNRCIFFRNGDVGKVMKSEIVAERASELDPDAKIIPLVMRIQELNDWNFDIVLGCLDNISARLHVNAHSKFHGIPYVDGATDGFMGKVTVVLKQGPCLQCMMNRTHSRIVDERFSCTGDQKQFTPRAAAEITTTSAVAAIQVRETLKIISGKLENCISATYYNGVIGETFNVTSPVNPICPNHGGD